MHAGSVVSKVGLGLGLGLGLAGSVVSKVTAIIAILSKDIPDNPSSKALNLTLAPILTEFEGNDEYSKDVHIDGDCLGVEESNMLPPGKRAWNMWTLLSEKTTQPLVLVCKNGRVVHNPFQVIFWHFLRTDIRPWFYFFYNDTSKLVNDTLT